MCKIFTLLASSNEWNFCSNFVADTKLYKNLLKMYSIYIEDFFYWTKSWELSFFFSSLFSIFPLMRKRTKGIDFSLLTNPDWMFFWVNLSCLIKCKQIWCLLLSVEFQRDFINKRYLFDIFETIFRFFNIQWSL